jgi:hypothetical protein
MTSGLFFTAVLISWSTEAAAGEKPTSTDLSSKPYTKIEYSVSARRLISSIPYAEPFVISAKFPKGATRYFRVAWRQGEVKPEDLARGLGKPLPTDPSPPEPTPNCESSENDWCYRDAIVPVPGSDAPQEFQVLVDEKGGLAYRRTYTFAIFYESRLTDDQADEIVKSTLDRIDAAARRLADAVAVDPNGTHNTLQANPHSFIAPLAEFKAALSTARLDTAVAGKIGTRQPPNDLQASLDAYEGVEFNRAAIARAAEAAARALTPKEIHALAAPAAAFAATPVRAHLLDGGYTAMALFNKLGALAQKPSEFRSVLIGAKDLVVANNGAVDWAERTPGRPAQAMHNAVAALAEFKKAASAAEWTPYDGLYSVCNMNESQLKEIEKAENIEEETKSAFRKWLKVEATGVAVSIPAMPAPQETKTNILDIYASVDIGVAYMNFCQGSAYFSPTAAVNIYFAPEDGNAPFFGKHYGFRRHFSAIVGVTMAQFAQTGSHISGLFSLSVTPFVGLGIRPVPYARVSGGLVFAKAQGDAPLSTDEHAVAGGFVAASIDFNLFDLMSTARAAFK